MDEETRGIVITSDLHVRGQYKTGIDFLQGFLSAHRRVPKCDALRGIEYILAGDITPFTENGWHEDAGYQAKLKVLAETGDHGLAKKAQQEAWTTHKEEMIKYGLNSQVWSVELIRQLESYMGRGILKKMIKVMGNSTPIISADQRDACDLVWGRDVESTMEELVCRSDAITLLSDVTFDRFRDCVLITIPYSKDAEKQKRYLKSLESFEEHNEIRRAINNIYVIYHENRHPELLGVKRPAEMQCLHEMIGVVRDKYPNAEIYEVCGHTHKIPKERQIRTPENTFLVPVGVDKETLMARTILLFPLEGFTELDYHVG